VQAYEQCQVRSPTTDLVHHRPDWTQVVMVAVQLVLESVASLTKQHVTFPCRSWRFGYCASSFFVRLAGTSAVRQVGQSSASGQRWRAAAAVLPLTLGDVPPIPAVGAGAL
jgi:hypothetical protein